MAQTMQYAGFFQRLVALIIDGIIISVVSWILLMVLSNVGSAGANLANVIGLVLVLIYDVYFFTSTGQTPGCKVMSIKVVNANSELLSMGQAVIRVVVSYISGAVLLIGYLWMIWDANKQTWHDKAAGSFVIKV